MVALCRLALLVGCMLSMIVVACRPRLTRSLMSVQMPVQFASVGRRRCSADGTQLSACWRAAGGSVSDVCTTLSLSTVSLASAADVRWQMALQVVGAGRPRRSTPALSARWMWSDVAACGCSSLRAAIAGVWRTRRRCSQQSLSEAARGRTSMLDVPAGVSRLWQRIACGRVPTVGLCRLLC